MTLNLSLRNTQIASMISDHHAHTSKAVAYDVLIERLPIVPWTEMSKTNQPVNIDSAIVSFAPFFGTHEINTYRVFVTGVPVNIHRYLARSWATTLLARVALKHGVSSVSDKQK